MADTEGCFGCVEKLSYVQHKTRWFGTPPLRVDSVNTSYSIHTIPSFSKEEDKFTGYNNQRHLTCNSSQMQRWYQNNKLKDGSMDKTM